MMGHVHPHNAAAFTPRNPIRGEINGLIHPVPAVEAQLRQVLQVLASCRRIDHQCQEGCIGSNHKIPGKPPLKAKTGYAESLVLVVQLYIQGTEAAF